MKGILGWFKGHLVIFVMVLLMLGLLPTAYFLSARLNAGITKRQSQAYNDEKQKISRASKVTYSLPRISTDEPASGLSETRAPNDHVTNWYAEQRLLRAEQVAEVTRAAMTLNRAEHRSLVDSFPPRPGADQSTQRRAAQELARAITGDRGFDRSAYAVLFDRMGAGEPPDREEVAREVADFRDRQMDQVSGRPQGGRLSAQEEEDLTKGLVERRIGLYRRKADGISFYGSPRVLYGGEESGGSGLRSPYATRGGSSSGSSSTIPSVMPDTPPSLTEAYLWQWDYWVIEDLLSAIVKANSDSTGDPLPVPLSVVKRVESIRLDAYQMPKPASAGAVADDMGFGGSMARAGSSDRGAPEKVTLTGRKSGDGPFDVRQARMTVVVASSRLPALLSAIKTTNLMTVTDLDIEAVDVWDDLAQGYFYGEEHVVRATIGVESVWLREWTREFMPEPVREALGVTKPAGGAESDG